jgi:phosphohistidine phosphatase
MEIYLVQHGLAQSKQEDPARPLTPAGRREVERVARAVAAAGVRPACVLHSGKTRAQQTADILAAHLKPAQGVLAVEGLDPGDEPQRIRERVEQAEQPILLVGHLPHLSRLAALLLAEDCEREVVAFRNAGVVCLERREHRFAIRWVLTPELVASRASPGAGLPGGSPSA